MTGSVSTRRLTSKLCSYFLIFGIGAGNTNHRHLKPGGWVQQIEMSAFAKSDDGTVTSESPYHTWVEVFEKIGVAMGKSFFACETASQSLQDAGGFVNVHERRIKLPIGTWPKDKKLKQWGELNRQFLLQGLEGFSIRGLTSMLDVSSIL